MCDAARAVVRHRAAKFVFCHLFVGHSFDDVGTSDKHVARLVDHGDEVRDCG